MTPSDLATEGDSRTCRLVPIAERLREKVLTASRRPDELPSDQIGSARVGLIDQGICRRLRLLPESLRHLMPGGLAFGLAGSPSHSGWQATPELRFFYTCATLGP